MRLEQIDERLSFLPEYIDYMADTKLSLYETDGCWPDFKRLNGIIKMSPRARTKMLPVTFDGYLYMIGRSDLLPGHQIVTQAIHRAWEAAKPGLNGLENIKGKAIWDDTFDLESFADQTFIPNDEGLKRYFIPSYPSADKWGLLNDERLTPREIEKLYLNTPIAKE